MQQVLDIWIRFISVFPVELQGIVSLIIFVALVVSLIELIKRSFIWILLLIVLVPASIPILRTIADNVLYFLKVLLP